MKEQLFLTPLIFNPKPSFDNFVEGNNIEVISALQNRKLGQSIFLWGEEGSGKTHLLEALHAQKSILFTASTFPSKIQEIINLKAGYTILIDDVHLFSLEQQETLFNLFNIWKSHQQQDSAFCLISTANKPPMQLSMREDLRNRLGWGLVYSLSPLNDDDAKEALKQRASAKGLSLTPEVLQWIFTYCPRDMRTLFALLEALDAYSMSQKKPITIPLIKSLIQSQEILQ